MAIVRARQPALTRVLPHLQNRRYAVPQHFAPANLLTVGDSWTEVAAGEDLGWLQFRPTGAGITVVNQGASGRTFENSGAGAATSVEANIVAWLAAAPATDMVVCCTTGGNDMAGGGKSAATMQAAWDNVATAISNANAVGVFAGTPVSSFQSGAQRDEVRTFNAYVNAQCKARGWVFVDILGQFCDDTNIKPEWNNGDNVHLNVNGRRLLSQLMWSGIKNTRYRKAAAV